MKKQLLAIALLTAGIAGAQTFSENFSSATSPGLPASWLQNNVDGLIPDPAIASFSFATNAWVTRDYTSSTDPTLSSHGKVAVSTSYYNPTGTSNDWLITPSFTVPANGVLTWEGNAPDANFQDGYLVKISTTGTLTTNFSTTLLTVGAENSTWTSRSVNLNTYAGQTVRIAFINNSHDMDLLFLDNVSLIVPAAVDIKLTDAGPTGQASWGAVSSTKAITGTITNNGYTTITGFTAKYTDGVANGSTAFTGLNVAYGQTYNFSISTPYTISAATQSTLKVWADITGDALHTNDTLNAYVKGYSFVPTHKVVFEEGTGTWCGWCVRGAVYMDSMLRVNPTTTDLIAVHNSSSDPMTYAPYDNGIGTLISGYPTVLCGRAIEIGDPSDMFTMYANHLSDFALADLNLTSTYNSSTRVASVIVNTRIASSFPNNTTANDYRIAVVFTENHVTGTASGYDQHNYYSSASQNLPLVGAGHNFQTEPAVVPAASMAYNFVARNILGGFTGQANSLPSTLVAGTTYTSTTFTYTVPAAYNTNNMRAHALLVDAKTNEVYNGNSVILDPATASIKEITEKIEASVYPNPARNNAAIDLNLTKSETVTVNVLSVMGQVVYTQTFASVPTGKQTISLNTENWADGIYNVNISYGTGTITKKLSVVK